MGERVVTELVIDARPASVGQREYEAAMAKCAEAQQRQTLAFAKGAPSAARLAAAIERVKSQVDPLYAAQVKLEKQLGTLDAGFRRGLVTEEQVASIRAKLVAQQVAGLDQVQAAALRAAAGLNAEASASLKAANGNRLGNHNTANIAAQFQDIGVTTAMGMNPLQIALQQGTQLSAVLGSQGLTGVVKSLGAAFLTIVNPVSLITIGVIAVAAAGAQWLMSLRGDVKSADEALRAHESIIGEVKARWKGAEDALESYSSRNQSLVAAGARTNVVDMQRQLNEATTGFINAISVTLPSDVSQQFRFLIHQEFEPFAAAIVRLRDEAKAGKPDFDAFYQSVNATVSADATLQPVADRLFEASGNAEELWRNLQQAGVAARAAADGVSALVIASHGLTKQNGDLGFALGSRVEGDRSARSHQIEMDTIKAQSPAQLADIARRRTALELEGEAITEALRRQKIEEAGTLAFAQGSASQAQSADKVRDAYQNVVSSAEQRIAQAAIEAQSLGMTEQAAARLRATHDLLNAAEQAGVKIDAAKRDELTKLGIKTADATLRTKALTEAQQEQQKQIETLTSTLSSTIGSLFTKPIADAKEFFSTVLGGFASLGQANLKTGLSKIFDSSAFAAPKAANDNGGGWSEARAKVFGKSLGEGFGDFLKDNGDKIGAGLGGLSMGYQTQNPLMGAVGGALAGSAAGPWGAVIGGIAGFVGGLLGMNEALEKSKAALQDNRQSIESFIGVGYGKEVDEQAKALQAYKTQAAELIKLAEAAGDSKLIARIKAATAAYKDTLKAQAVQDRFDKARDDAIEAHRNEADALQGVIDRIKDFVANLTEFRKGLLLDKQFSPLNPKQMMLEAQKQFDLIAKKARLGDADAQGQLQGAARSYLDAARGYFGSSEGYQAIFRSVDQALGGVLGAAGGQLSSAERQLAATNKSLKALGDLHSAVLTIPQAIKQLQKVAVAAAKVDSKRGDKLQSTIEKLTRELKLNQLRHAA